MEDVTNLSGTILLLTVVQMYEFQEKLEKLKKTKLWITTENKKNKQIRLCRFSLFLVVVFSTVYKFFLGIINLDAWNIFRETNISYFLIRTRAWAYQRVKNVSFMVNFAFVLNEWSLAYRQTNVSHIVEAHLEPSQTSKIEPFRRKLHLRYLTGF